MSVHVEYLTARYTFANAKTVGASSNRRVHLQLATDDVVEIEGTKQEIIDLLNRALAAVERAED
jgi:hypothetical protein